MKTKSFRDEIRDKMKPLAVDYIDSIIYFRNYDKSDIHWKMIDLACALVKGTPYDPEKDMRLHMLLHKVSQQVTDHLDKEIGFSYDVGFNNRSKQDIENLGEKLVNRICEIVLTTFPDVNAVIVFKDKEIKPSTLKIPIRGLME